MKSEMWTKEQENYLRELYSKDCMILDFVSAFNEKFHTNRSKSSLLDKANRLNITNGFIGGNRSNHIKYLIEKNERLGQANTSNDGTLMKIVEYINSLNIIVEFQDQFRYRVHTSYQDFKKGNVKNPGNKIMYNRGYLGQGPYLTAEYKSGVKKPSKAYDAWRRMFDRCYNDKYADKYPTYKNSEVCEEWFCFQSFAKWFYDNYYNIGTESMEVDKDWLVVGNKLYSPEYCCLAPSIINTCLLTHDKLVYFNLPIGINPTASGKYKARCSEYGKRKDLGVYETIEEASNAYWKFKIKYVEQLAEDYRNYIPEKLYTAMINFKNTYMQRYCLYKEWEVA